MRRQLFYTLALVLATVASVTGRDTPGTLRLLPAETDAAYRRAIPDSENGALQRLRDDPRTIFYDESVIPRAYQNWVDDQGVNGIHSAWYNISVGAANGTEPFGNANREFPWGGPAGTTPGDNSRTFKGMRLPDGESIRIRNEPTPPNNGTAYRWEFPKGTIFLEVIQVRNPRSNTYHTFQIRTRTRQAGNEGWSVNEYRPFVSENDLIAKIEQINNRSGKLNNLLAHLQSSRSLQRLNIKSPQAVVTIDRTGLADVLPPIEDSDVITLLSGTYKSSLNSEWKTRGDDTAYSPTTQADFHVVPTGYQGYFHPVSATACVTCHESVFKHVNDLDRPSRDWYGRVRGNDGIFSWHPFANASISHNGFMLPVYVDRKWVDAGLVTLR